MIPPPPLNGIPNDMVFILISMLASVVVLLITAYYVRVQNKGPVTKPLVILLSLCAAWSSLNVLVLFELDQGLKILVEQVEYLSIIFIPVVLLITIMTYLGRSSILRIDRYPLLLALPTVSVVMLLTNDYHHLFFTAHESVAFGQMSILTSTTGPYYLVHILYVYALVAIAVALLFHHMVSLEGHYRRRDQLILIGISLPFIGDAISILGYAPFSGGSWAPMLFMIMGFAFIYALYKYHTFNLMPLAHGIVWKSTPDPLFVIDAQSQVVDVNEAGSSLIGRSQEELVGKNMGDVLSSISQNDEHVLLESPEIKEITVSHNGSKKEYEVLNTPILDRTGSAQGALILFRDITMHKAIQEKALQSELEYRLLIEKTPFPMAVVGTRSGTIHLINRSMETLLKGSREEIGSKGVGSFFLSRDDLDRLVSVLDQDSIVENYEAAMLNNNGEQFWAFLSAIPISFGGELVTILAINDISDRKMAEALISANKKLSLLSGITRHDLLNKFMAIGGYLELLKNTNDPGKRVQIMSKLEQSSKAVQELISFTRDYEELGVKVPVWQSVNEVIVRARRLLDLTRIQISVDVGPLQVYADSMLDKVFYNLMDNSIRHGERVTRIRIYFEDVPGQGACIIYEDDGAGITPEDKKLLFHQGHGKNTGQGMFLTKEILLITGMKISEDGEPGKGVRFRIKMLPKMYSMTAERS
jgi:PAS domain S-box-containing protein